MSNSPASEDRREAVATFFDKGAQSWHDRYSIKTFDAYNYQARAEIALAWLTRLYRAGSRTLLELGCGAGVQANAASKLGWQVVASDLSTGILKEASDHYERPSWVASSIDHLPFRPSCFDALMMLGVIGYVSDPPRALSAVRAMVRPGGHLIVSWASRPPLLLEKVSNTVSRVPDELYLRAKQLATGKPINKKSRGQSFYEEYNRFWGEAEFRPLLEAADFEILELRAVNYGRLRFMGKPLWPERVDITVSRAVDRLSSAPAFGGIREFGRTHLALLRVPD